jgi:hypothetical protein
MNPKHVQMPKDLMTKEDVAKYFGLVHNKNGYSYVFCEDPMFIEKVETLWMLIHQKRCVPSTRLVSLSFTKKVYGHQRGKNKLSNVCKVDKCRTMATAKKIDINVETC